MPLSCETRRARPSRRPRGSGAGSRAEISTRSTGAAAWSRLARLTVGPTATNPRAAPLAEGADHDLAGVDADAHVQRDAVAALDSALSVVEVARASAAPTRTARWASSSKERLQAEDRHHRVADELLHDAALLLDRLLPAREVGADDLAGVLGVELAREHGEVDEVGEDHGDQPALLGREASRARLAAVPAAAPAPSRPRRRRAAPRCASRARDRLLDRGDLVRGRAVAEVPARRTELRGYQRASRVTGSRSAPTCGTR